MSPASEMVRHRLPNWDECVITAVREILGSCFTVEKANYPSGS